MTNVIGFDPVAWSIDGGLHPASLLRRLAYAATQGNEGIVTLLDCKAHQLASAGPQVRIDAGAIVILNRSTGGANQSYIASAAIESRLDVDPTTGSARSDLVVVRLEDPEFTPWPDPPVGQEPTFQYTKPVIIKGVPNTTATFAELNLGYSGYAVARIDLPSGTTNITDAMVKDLRKPARPRSELQQYTTLFTTGQALISVPWNPWATEANRNIVVPPWAAQVIIEGTFGGVKANAGGTWGETRIRIGSSGSSNSVVTGDIGYDVNTPVANNYDRIPLFVAGTKTVPAAIRGTTQALGVEGHKVGGDTSIQVDNYTVLSMKLTFLEVAA